MAAKQNGQSKKIQKLTKGTLTAISFRSVYGDYAVPVLTAMEVIEEVERKEAKGRRQQARYKAIKPFPNMV